MTGKPMHLSCNRSLRNLKTDIVECHGNVYVRRPTELLTADFVSIDLAHDNLHAEGNVVYFTGETVIYGAKMDFNFKTETGVIEDGRIESERYELLGEHIERFSDEEFRIRDGEYTTCRDCPASWRLAAKSVDFRVDGYAFLGNVYVKITDAPTLYVPYAVIPVKTKRQSGLLFPKFATNQLNGFMIVQPFYWAISRSTDATIGLGYYTQRGRKGEGEFRYALAPRSKGEFKAFSLRDKTFPESPYRERWKFPPPDYYDRWAFEYSHNLELPWRIEQKLHWLDASDRDYARLFPDDISGAGEPALVSDASLSRAGRDASVWIDAKRIRNNITPELVGFDSDTVQLLPSVSIATVDHQIAENFPLHWGLTSNYSRFWRKNTSFDPIYPLGTSALRSDFIPGETPLRRAHRITAMPELYFTTRMWDVFEVVPSVQYRAFYYDFGTALAQPTWRGFLVAQTDFATTVERIYGANVKHKMRPSLTYSVIPMINQKDPGHPFFKQLSASGYQFDESDIVPVTNENQQYFVPLGHSVTYQFGNKFILKSDAPPYTYRKTIDVTSGQSINFVEYRKAKDVRQPLSRFFTYASVNTLRIQGNGEYYYYPYSKASSYNLGVNYIFSQYTRRLLAFQRSLGVSYSYNQVTTHTNSVGGSFVWSVNDYFQPRGGITYQFPMDLNSALSPGIVLSANASLTYQSPSQCYRLVLLGSRTFGRGWDISFNVPINLTGGGFTSFTEGGGVAGGVH